MKKEEIKSLRISDYHYILPDDKIAKYPLPVRDTSKLLLYKNGTVSADIFNRLAQHIPDGSLLVFNNTRVIHARLIFTKPTGAAIEVFCLSPHEPADYVLNFQQRQRCSWHCMIGNAKRWKGDEPLQLTTDAGTLTAKKMGTTDNDVVVEFSWDNPDISFSELLEAAGKLPIPPYLNRPSEAEDDVTYQTVYSKIEGSVAAPTAGLHFTEEVMQSLQKRGIHTAEVTLHVGAGTFRPVKSETMAGHDMHTECVSVSRQTINALLRNKGKLVVVGTTSMRTVESLYYIGRKLQEDPQASPHELAVEQWEPYEESIEISPKQALQNIVDYMDRNGLDRLISATRIIIVPGYRFHFPDAIITNFHQPESTLLLLISAFVGDDWRRIYDYALQNDFRFLSYGDSSLLWKR